MTRNMTLDENEKITKDILDTQGRAHLKYGFLTYCIIFYGLLQVVSCTATKLFDKKQSKTEVNKNIPGENSQNNAVIINAAQRQYIRS